MPRTLAQEILVLLDEPSVKQAPVTIGQLSRRLGVSSALTRLCARQLLADGVVDAVMLEHAGTTTIQALSRVRPAEVVAGAPGSPATVPAAAELPESELSDAAPPESSVTTPAAP